MREPTRKGLTAYLDKLTDDQGLLAWQWVLPREPFFTYLAPGLGRDLAFQWSSLHPGVALC